MEITTIGVDLAKNVFQVHGVDQRGKAVLRKQLRREQTSFFCIAKPHHRSRLTRHSTRAYRCQLR